jgi:DNA-binding CsgD family transcriptional regulator/sugar-specific transcriptional regulator TrmB
MKVSVFSVIGLDERADVIYRALLRGGKHTKRTLAAELNLLEQQISSTVTMLAEASLVHVSKGHEEIIRPIDPKLGISAALAQCRTEIARRQQEMEQAETVLAELAASYEELRMRKRCKEVEFLEGADAVEVRLAELAASATKEVVGMSAGAPCGRVMEVQGRLDQKLLAHGVSLRRLFLDSIRNHALMYAYAERLSSVGGLLRTAPVLPLNVTIFDQSAALLSTDPDIGEEAATVLYRPEIISALMLIFEQFWDKGQPLGKEVRKDESGLTPADRELLRLLSEGCTDEATARKVGVSLRTVRRMTAHLMNVLNARSRFEAGYLAAKRGWL